MGIRPAVCHQGAPARLGLVRRRDCSCVRNACSTRALGDRGQVVEATRTQLVHFRVWSPEGRRPMLCCAATQQARHDNKSVLRVLFLVRTPMWNFKYICWCSKKGSTPIFACMHLKMQNLKQAWTYKIQW